MLNQVNLEGNLTAAPELKTAASGKSYARFTIAQTERRQDERGEWIDGATSFFDFTAFGYAAQSIERAQKGDRLVVWGSARQENWEKDGQRRSKISFFAEQIRVIPRKPKEDQGYNGGYSAPPKESAPKQAKQPAPKPKQESRPAPQNREDIPVEYPDDDQIPF